MLKKLYKHEFHALFRYMLPVYTALLALAIFSRLSWMIKLDNPAISSMQGLSTLLFILAIASVFIVGIVIAVVRFYQHLLSHQGYLSFTLPVTATQHILCKLICGWTVIVINFLVALGSLLIFSIGTEAMSEIWEALSIGINALQESDLLGTVVMIAAGVLVLLLVSLFTLILVFYTAMAFGQQFKNKIGGSVLSFFIIYAIDQVLNSVIMSVIGLTMLNSIDNLADLANLSKINVLLICMIIYYILLGVVYFFVTRYMLSRKLNLE